MQEFMFKLAKKFDNKYSKTPEAPKNAPFGEFAWTKHREGFDNKIYYEETELEIKIYKEIKNHFASKHIGLSKIAAKLLAKILKNNWYSKIIHEPKHKTLYRGILIKDKEDVCNLLKIKREDFEDKGSIAYNSSIKITNGNSTSWTYKKIISKDFSTYYGKRKKGYAITFIADIDDNRYKFIAGPGGLYDVEGLSKWHLEKESIGLEPIIIRKIEWEKLD